MGHKQLSCNYDLGYDTPDGEVASRTMAMLQHSGLLSAEVMQKFYSYFHKITFLNEGVYDTVRAEAGVICTEVRDFMNMYTLFSSEFKTMIYGRFLTIAQMKSSQALERKGRLKKKGIYG